MRGRVVFTAFLAVVPFATALAAFRAFGTFWPIVEVRQEAEVLASLAELEDDLVAGPQPEGRVAVLADFFVLTGDRDVAGTAHDARQVSTGGTRSGLGEVADVFGIQKSAR